MFKRPITLMILKLICRQMAKKKNVFMDYRYRSILFDTQNLKIKT